ncbi:MAG: glutamate--tRNA ligase, partial [Spirochaetes bacterium]|nr:glutamate--tRNA ligase [Spirochaetota bacterium]
EAGEKSYEYTGRCKKLSDAERKKFQDEGRKPSVRFAVPEDETIVIEDIIKGRVVFGSENIGGDFIIVRSDGVPVYNYLVVIDDSLMKVTHVIRGEDHLSNTPKQIAIAKALGFPLPQFAHLSLVLGPDRSKLSKRHGMTSVEMYRKEGYLPEALVNYLAILGWAAEGGEEILPFDEIIRQIDISTLSKTPGVFDFQKLKWMNGNYIRNYDLKKITDLFIPYIEEAGYNIKSAERGWLEEVVSILRLGCEVLPDIKISIGLFMDDVIEPDGEADALLKEDYSKKIIAEAKRLVSSDINEGNFQSDLVKKIGENTSIKGKNLFMPVRAMLTGRLKGPVMDKAMPLFGFANCKKRIEYMYNKYVDI